MESTSQHGQLSFLSCKSRLSIHLKQFVTISLYLRKLSLGQASVEDVSSSSSMTRWTRSDIMGSSMKVFVKGAKKPFPLTRKQPVTHSSSRSPLSNKLHKLCKCYNHSFIKKSFGAESECVSQPPGTTLFEFSSFIFKLLQYFRIPFRNHLLQKFSRISHITTLLNNI